MGGCAIIEGMPENFFNAEARRSGEKTIGMRGHCKSHNPTAARKRMRGGRLFLSSPRLRVEIFVFRSPLMPLLASCTALSKSFGSRVLFENISLGISEGERLGLIGP